jgi:hypothetical protein
MKSIDISRVTSTKGPWQKFHNVPTEPAQFNGGIMSVWSSYYMVTSKNIQKVPTDPAEFNGDISKVQNVPTDTA